MCPPGMECFMGRCVPCGTFKRPGPPPMRGPPPAGFYAPPRPVIVRPVYRIPPMGPIRSVTPMVVSPPIINTPIAPLSGPIGTPFAGPIGAPQVPGPMMAGSVPFGPAPVNQGMPPGCAPGFRFFNNQCIRSGAVSLKPLNAISIGIMILFLSFFN